MGNHRSRILILTFILYGFTGFAQEHFNFAEKAIKKGRELYGVKLYDSAAIYFQKGIELADQEKDEWNKTSAQAELGRSWIHLREFEKAREISETILNSGNATIRAKIIAHQNLGMIQSRVSKNYIKESYHNHQALKMALPKSTASFADKNANDSLHTSNQTQALQALAYMHRNRKVYDSAHYYLNELTNLAENAEPFSLSNLARHRLDLIPLYFYENKLEDVKKELRNTQSLVDRFPLKTQEEFSLTATHYNLLGVYYSRVSNNDSSLMAKRKQEHIMAVSPRIDSVQLAQLQSNMGISYYILGDLNKAFEYEQKAFTLKTRILRPDNPLFADSYKWLGIYRIAQAYAGNEALEYLREALRITQKHFGKTDARTVDAMHNLSTGLNATGKFHESLVLSREALSIQADIRGGDYTTGAIYTAIADNLIALDSLDEAIKTYKELIQLSNNSKVNMSNMKIKAESGLGYIYIELKQYVKAEEYLKTAEEILVQTYGPNDYGLAAVYNAISNSFRRRGRLKEALEANTRAIEVNSYDSKTFNIDSVPLSLLARKQILFVDSYILRTQLLLEKEAEEKTYDLEEFWETFENSVEIVENWISEQTNSSDIISLLSLNKTLYSTGIDALWLADSTRADSQTSFKMWQLSEKSKAVNQKLNDKKRQLTEPLEINVQILKEQRTINTEIALYKSLALNGNDHDSVGAGLFKALQAKRDFEKRIKSESQRKYLLNYIGDDIAYDAVKTLLDNKQTIVDYFVSEENLYAFVINNSSVHHFKFDWTEELQNQILNFKQGLVSDSGYHYHRASNSIYQKIFEPLESVIKGNNVIIIPDKNLWNVNFDLLKTVSHDSSNVKNNYLIEKYAVSYSYSTSLLLNDKKNSRTKGQVLAFAYAKDDLIEPQLGNMRDAAKQNLPGTAKEVRTLATAVNGDFYYGIQANEQKFKEIASGYNILHLALHGEVNDKDPDNSKLFFTGNEQSVEDNTLHTFELYNMNLNADLAVLSACNTGAGKISDGEGIMSLGKAFQYAGVNSVLLSQWEVSDAIAPVIIEGFYNYLKEGQNKAEALRSAKLDFLNTSNNITSNPYYWGSFFILGNTESISFRTNDNRWFWLLGISLIIALVIARKRKTRSLAA